MLRRGVRVWNQWRIEHPTDKTDLQGANLRGVVLFRADLKGASLDGADLQGVNLQQANLQQASLQGVNFSGADLIGANLQRASLQGADLMGADLLGANLQEANLQEADLGGADLQEANLQGANLQEADLGGANLQEANLQGSNMQGANLYASQVLSANFTEAELTGACIADWHIGASTRLEEVVCDHIFRGRDSDGKFIERRPANPDKNFELGEFTKLFQVSQDTVELIFREGMNWKAFAYSFSEANTKVFIASGEELYLKKYEVLGDGLVRLEVIVPPGLDKQSIHANLERTYEIRIAQLKGEYDRKIARLEGKIESKNEDYQQLLRTLKPGDTYVNSFKNEINQTQTFHAPVGNVAGTNYGSMTAYINQNGDEITRLLTNLRKIAQSFPDAQSQSAKDYLDDIATDLKEPEKCKPSRLKASLAALLGLAIAVGGSIATATDFANNVLELSEKLNVPVETFQPQLEQFKQIHPEFDW